MHTGPKIFILFIILLSGTAEGGTRVSACPPNHHGRESMSYPDSATGGGIISGIIIFGNKDVPEELILARLGIKRGDPFTRDTADKGINRVRELSAVETATLSAIPLAEGREVKLIISISEQPTFSVTPLISRNFANKIAVGISVTERNFLHRNQHISASVLVRGATIIESEWYDKSLLNSPVGLKLELKYSDYHYPYPHYEGLFINDNIRRLEAGLGFNFAMGKRLEIYLRPGMDMIDTADPMLENQGKGRIPEIPPGLYSTLETGARFNSLNRNFYPTGGLILSLSRKDWGVARVDAEIKNFRYRASSGIYFRIKNSIWNFFASSTLTYGNVPLPLKQYAGGEGSIRGYQYGEFIGNNSFNGRAEVRFPLNFSTLSDPVNPLMLVDLAVFTDTGACWSEPDNLEYNRIHSGFGFELGFISGEKMMLKMGYAWHMRSSGTLYLDAVTAH